MLAFLVGVVLTKPLTVEEISSLLREGPWATEIKENDTKSANLLISRFKKLAQCDLADLEDGMIHALELSPYIGGGSLVLDLQTNMRLLSCVVFESDRFAKVDEDGKIHITFPYSQSSGPPSMGVTEFRKLRKHTQVRSAWRKTKDK
ncbi:MAG: hypothetical protein KF784_10920 [Fimbriimonadaceae bacterium]|nr:hypothetical protein [Fimbriimonadaceae bacterium]